MNLIEAVNVTKTCRNGAVAVEALKDVSFGIPAKAFTSFVGLSGSGVPGLARQSDHSHRRFGGLERRALSRCQPSREGGRRRPSE